MEGAVLSLGIKRARTGFRAGASVALGRTLIIGEPITLLLPAPHLLTRDVPNVDLLALFRLREAVKTGFLHNVKVAVVGILHMRLNIDGNNRRPAEKRTLSEPKPKTLKSARSMPNAGKVTGIHGLMV